jgi:lysophospholipase L1-like esterase
MKTTKKINDCSSWLFIFLLTLSPVISAQTKKVACIGNSITEGYGLSFPQQHSYPAVLQIFLGNEDFEIRNYGVGARSMMHNADIPYWNTNQYQEALAWKPDIVIIKLGTNDAKPGNWNTHKSEFKGDYIEFVHSFQSLSSEPQVYVCYPTPIFPKSSYADPNVITNEIIPVIGEVAVETGSTVIDLHTPLEDKGYLFDDGLHPNALGARYLAYYVADAISPAFVEDISIVTAVTPVKTEADLKAMLAMNDNPFAYILENDIVVTESWTSGNIPLIFRGVLDGNGYVISGLNINDPNTDQIGLVQQLTNGTIKNLGIETASINGNANVGGFAGKIMGGTVENCYISNSYVEGRDHVGSLAGQIESGDNGGGLIQNCYATATVYSRGYQGGGLVGTSSGNPSGRIANCYFSGILGVKNPNRAGGIMALKYNDSALTIENCVNLATEVNCGSIYRIASIGGRPNAVFTNNYALDNLTYTDTGSLNVTVENGTDVTAERAKEKSFYETNLRWDFADTWNINEENTYPVLKVFKANNLSSIQPVNPVDLYRIGILNNTLQITNLPEKAWISLYNIAGQLLSKTTASGNYSCHLPAKGLYMVVMETAGNKLVVKIINK